MDCDNELPRFTRYLRAFTNLEGWRTVNMPEQNIDQLYEVWCKPKSVSFYELYNLTQQILGKKSCILDTLYSIKLLSTELCGDDQGSDVIGDTAILVIKTFIDENKVLNKHRNILKQLYGNPSNGLIDKIWITVAKLKDVLPAECLDYINGNIKSHSCISWRCPEFHHPYSTTSSPNIESLRDLTSPDSLVDFSMAYNEKLINAGASTSNAEKNDSKKQVYGLFWLMKQIKYFYKDNSEVTSDDISNTIISLLITSKSNDELQNELFELLGFEAFGLIQQILDNRNGIVLSHSIELKRKNKQFSEPVQVSPNLSQVTVKHESEKQIEKLIRKEEKKFSKFAAREDLDERNFNLPEIPNKNSSCKKTQNGPQVISTSPQVISTNENRVLVEQRDKFPHVYDSLKDIQMNTGYVNGGKILLPENVKRIDIKTYEEVSMPIVELPPLQIGKNLVAISSLDDIGQIAFQGMKNLNRIQSIVFDSAYNTQHNLLICAPTGAGKTNVALLTILSAIRQNTVNGTLKKDEFKIIYVAPMKALAAEMTANFAKRLKQLGIIVKELTGDMQLTKSEIMQTQMIVTTPEKWDVVTRKGTGDSLIKQVKLLIIDEVHLLHGDRGPVVEALVARTLRQVESSQSMIRIVGLSATLPNYLDVARFLRVNPKYGLFYFDSRFRPVPLKQTFIGVKAIKALQQVADMDSICYDKVVEEVRNGHQVMIFVHARNVTTRTANILVELARDKGQRDIFLPEDSSALGLAKSAMARAKSKQLPELFDNGFAIHHAGLLRSDRQLVEKYFGGGLIKVLVCTATLAWGVNLPAHAVIIRGTEIYDAKHGSFIDLGILDVLQIFGRAGRPQFDTTGHGIIITTHAKLKHYLSLLTNQIPIESSFIDYLADNLNAEVSLGTISNINEAVEWLSYTYLYVRMKMNPLVYGLNYQDVLDDPNLDIRRRELIEIAAKKLDKAKMIRYTAHTGGLSSTDLGRTASNFYIKYDTIEIFNEKITSIMGESEILSMISNAQEFQQLKVREEEMEELEDLINNYCEYDVAGGKENLHGKVNILLQTYLNRGKVTNFSLISDLSYITQNAVRLFRGLFEIALRRNNGSLTGKLLEMALMMEHQQYSWETPFRQFSILGYQIIEKIEAKDYSIRDIREMDSKEIGILLKHQKMGVIVKKCAFEFPLLELTATLHPVTRSVLKVKLSITPDFNWNDKIHGKLNEPFWILVDDPNDNIILHSEYFLITRKQVILKETQELVITMPIMEPAPPQYIIRALSDRWLGCNSIIPISIKNLILPELHPPHTELLDLQPLPVSALNNDKFEKLFKFTHFNPIQTQMFHCLYYTDSNILLGAPTGSGKTIVAEIAMFRVFNKYPKSKVVYIAPLKALVREKLEDWKLRLEGKLKLSVVELTGDVTPDINAITNSDVIVTTPEKWDGISRSWQTRGYVQQVALIILDEVHLLGEERGPVLEVIVSRTNFISAHTESPLRIIALSTAIANARDLANWLGIKEIGLYNFRPSVRPVPLEVHVFGFPGKHYCPRMATMNRPAYQYICQYSPAQPVLIFVSSRRQTRLTALDLIANLASENNPKQWMHTTEEDMEQIISTIKDSNLRLTLAFGIGLHHAGLQERDRKTVEELFLNQKIQVLVATATLAWGVNLPAHLVIVKGTEYYDGKTKRYVDMPITDVLQMMGRAGRPQFDNQGVAVILVHDVKKQFYLKFLYQPFPVESSLLSVLPDHLSAEIVSGTIQTKQEALDYLTWTYFFRRLLKNPTFYGLESLEPNDVNKFLSTLINSSLNTLHKSGLISVDEDERTLNTTSLGRIAAYFYLSHITMLHFHNNLDSSLNLEKCLYVMCHSYEYSLLPVRHNEENYNKQLAEFCPYKVDPLMLDSPHVKTFLLLQAHFSRLDLPITDYYTDLKSVLDQSVRILQGMIDVCAESGWLATTLRLQQIIQMIMQARWIHDSPYSVLPHVDSSVCSQLEQKLSFPSSVCISFSKGYSGLAKILIPTISDDQLEEIYQILTTMPVLKVTLSILLVGVKCTECCKSCEEQLVKPNQKIFLHSNQEYMILINLNRLNRLKEKRSYAPKFHKPKSEGWFVTLGMIENEELLAMKRITGPKNKLNVKLTFWTPENIKTGNLSLYVLSDTYLGLDQQYIFPIEVTNSVNLTEEYSLF